MRYAIIIARVLLGIVFVVFGSNAFLHFIPMPPMQGQAGAFIGALINSGYVYVVAILQVIGGLLLLAGRFIPLGLTLLGPVIVNIMLYHIFLDPSGLPLAGVISILTLFLLLGASRSLRRHFSTVIPIFLTADPPPRRS
jgi:putative oxidoreductase